MSETGFDPHAERYQQELAQGLMLSGESSDYFLRGRLQRVRQLLGAAHQPAAILDFGCGIGTAAPVLAELFPQARLTGVDVSPASLALARTRHGALCEYCLPDQIAPASVDLVYCNGVFHHIPIAQRAAAMAQIRTALRPGGVLALWDNNPWSPAARWVMSRIPFDRDAVMLWPAQARRLVADAGMVYNHREYHFVFPRMLSALRWLERPLRPVPAGAQYLVWASRT